MGLAIDYSAISPFSSLPSSSCWTDRRYGSANHISVPFKGGTSVIKMHGPRRLWNFKQSQTCRAQVEVVQGVKEVAAVAAGQSEITWQIVVGSIAGITPFIVAGVEFSKRIIEQRRCEVCKGSGLILVGRYYRKCSGCGGFLPWQSWQRFFQG